MRTMKELIKDVLGAPRGFNADGRAMGLGLATAMEAARRDPSTEVEDYLRREAATGSSGERNAPVS
ncbi:MULTISPECIES: hypothetical protein [unclassified Amycolatopsis]|uniref:hypothetical protein n=1 Tax=unclassified Amycolatopsis TaxID=2618356 RepID=UPI00128FDF41|nr:MULTISPECIES: hypothetical protein [unclassified Amycolatopsis]MBN6040535.1 hypothetical protein [Amycolatopsis sp. 195334CR]QFU88990.1 hypothetical protein YIM_19055 [Amycolatopsis sp. YIM 10]